MLAAEASAESRLLDLAREARHYHLFYDCSDRGTVRLPAAAADELIRRLAPAVTSQVRQIVAVPPDGRPRRGVEQAMWADALRGRRELRRTQRLYLLASGESSRGTSATALRCAAEQDGVEALCLGVPPGGGLVRADAQSNPVTDLWLIDDRMVVRRELSPNNGEFWLVSVRDRDVRSALEQWNRLWEAGLREATVEPVGGQAPMLTGALLRSAPMMRAAAPVLCSNHALLGGQDCGWYHGIWQYLRLFDMVSSPSWHADFFLDSLRAEIHQRGARRILISGTADYTMLAYVLFAANGPDGKPVADIDIHVVDQCETALFACRWYAKSVNATVTPHWGSVVEFADSRPGNDHSVGQFDIVVADAFLTRFDRIDAKTVTESWYRLLNPGGSVVTTVRLHPRNRWQDDVCGAGEPDGWMADPVDAFELRLRARMQDLAGIVKVDPEDLAAAARGYAARMTSHDLGDVAEVEALFRAVDFEIEVQDEGEVRGELVGSEYMRIVSRKRFTAR